MVPLLQMGEFTSLQSTWDFLASGGPIMIPIGICSVLALAFTVERLARLSRRRILPRTVDEVLSTVERGEYAAALDSCAKIDAPAARILAAGLRRAGFTTQEIERAMEDQGRKEVEKLRANIRPLNVIVTLTPMLGLFGTIVGINEAFHVVARVGMGKADQLAHGIEIAGISTIAGLLVAMPTLVASSHLSGRVRRLALLVEEKLSPVVDRIAHRPGGVAHAA